MVSGELDVSLRFGALNVDPAAAEAQAFACRTSIQGETERITEVYFQSSRKGAAPGGQDGQLKHANQFANLRGGFHLKRSTGAFQVFERTNQVRSRIFR